MSFALRSLLVFLSVGAVDVVWVYYNQASQHAHKAWTAAVASALIILLGSFTTVSYVEDHRMVGPAVLAALLATYFTVRFKRN